MPESTKRNFVEPLADGGEQEVKVRVKMDEDDGGCTAYWDGWGR